jgi:hypothetical protein
MIRRLVLVGLLGVCEVVVGQTGLAPWQEQALHELSVRCLGSGPEAPLRLEESTEWVDRLAENGITALPAEDLAAFAMLGGSRERTSWSVSGRTLVSKPVTG